MDARTFAEAMLDGAAMTGEFRHEYVSEDGTKTCALGAAYYRLGFVRTSSTGFAYIDGEEGTDHDFRYKYTSRYGSTVIDDNDDHGRDFVLGRVKEMINEGII